MARSLNFRAFAQPTLDLTMNDAEGSVFLLTAPTVELVERLEANQDDMIATMTKGDRASLDELWNLAAALISCNREGIKVTTEDLKGRYRMSYGMLLVFFDAYGEFIDEIKAVKN